MTAAAFTYYIIFKTTSPFKFTTTIVLALPGAPLFTISVLS